MDKAVENELRAEITVLTQMVNVLLEACVRGGQVAPHDLLAKLESMAAAPTFIGTDPKYNAEYRRVIGGWISMVMTDYEDELE